MSDNEKEEKKDNKDKRFMLEILKDLETIKGNIYSTQIFPAYRNVQKLSDRIKQRLMEL